MSEAIVVSLVAMPVVLAAQQLLTDLRVASSSNPPGYARDAANR